VDRPQKDVDKDTDMDKDVHKDTDKDSVRSTKQAVRSMKQAVVFLYVRFKVAPTLEQTVLKSTYTHKCMQKHTNRQNGDVLGIIIYIKFSLTMLMLLCMFSMLS